MSIFLFVNLDVLQKHYGHGVKKALEHDKRVTRGSRRFVMICSNSLCQFCIKGCQLVDRFVIELADNEFCCEHGIVDSSGGPPNAIHLHVSLLCVY